MKVILDFIPNHTSDEHEWFEKSLKKEGKFKDYYVWKNEGNQTGPPNDWVIRRKKVWWKIFRTLNF